MMISEGACLFVFSKFCISGFLQGVKGQKMVQNEKNSVALCISGTIHHMTVICSAQE